MIVPYESRFRERCIEMFQSNIPEYFMHHELKLFENWLDGDQTEDYYVLIHDDVPVACGGIYFDERKMEAGLSWGLTDAKYRSMGFGKALTLFRIELMKTKYPQSKYMLETTQLTKGFYQKLGFEVISFTIDGFGKGLDKYYMRMR